MTTLKTLATESFNYKGVEVKRVDTIEEGFSTLTCYPTRSWSINGKKAFTVKINGETKLASYLEEEASKGGSRTVLKDFNPECGFYIQMTEELKQTIIELGRYVEQEVTETDF
jgi:hypothetical protein